MGQAARGTAGGPRRLRCHQPPGPAARTPSTRRSTHLEAMSAMGALWWPSKACAYRNRCPSTSKTYPDPIPARPTSRRARHPGAPKAVARTPHGAPGSSATDGRPARAAPPSSLPPPASLLTIGRDFRDLHGGCRWRRRPPVRWARRLPARHPTPRRHRDFAGGRRPPAERRRVHADTRATRNRARLHLCSFLATRSTSPASPPHRLTASPPHRTSALYSRPRNQKIGRRAACPATDTQHISRTYSCLNPATSSPPLTPHTADSSLPPHPLYLPRSHPILLPTPVRVCPPHSLGGQRQPTDPSDNGGAADVKAPVVGRLLARRPATVSDVINCLFYWSVTMYI